MEKENKGKHSPEELRQAEKDLLELADISTEKQLEEIKVTNLRAKTCKKNKKRDNSEQ